MTVFDEAVDVAPEADDDTTADSRTRSLRQDQALGLVLFGVIALPLVIALVRLSRDRWYPVLDLAMTELRVRDVGTWDTPLIGLPGRIGDEIPIHQGSHPGPLYFWVLAPVYRVLGQAVRIPANRAPQQ